MRVLLQWLTIASCLLLVSLPRAARAAAPSADLLSRLAVHAAGFETMKTHASYSVAGELQTLAIDGAVDDTKEMTANVTSDGKKAHLDVVKYTENGADKTDEAKQKAKDEAAKKKDPKKKKSIRMPFHAAEQSRYDFDVVETDAQDPSRVRITFVPKQTAEDTIEGSAWVDTKTGTVVSAGFKLSQPPSFVDYVHITMEFAEATPLGPAVSHVALTGKGGFLFFKKEFRADAKLTKYAISP
jgi:hypothetical protein